MNDTKAERLGTANKTGMIVTDLDGTLRTSGGTFGRADLEALRTLGAEGIVRAIATGRSLYSFRKAVVDSPLPIDYVLFSSGAGVTREPEGDIVRQVSLEAAETARAAEALVGAGLDFMIHLPIPDNHKFAYHATGVENPDFARRIELYGTFCWPISANPGTVAEATQLVAVVPSVGGEAAVAELRRELVGLTVIRTTSPLDGQSTWIEIFPGSVSKGQTASWLAQELGIAAKEVLAVGNDYNDTDLLDWAGSAFVVDNAPPALRERYGVVASNDACGLAEAVGRWPSRADGDH